MRISDWSSDVCSSDLTEVQVYAVPEHGLATIWDADVLIWAASQLLAADDRGLPISRFFRFTPYQLLTSIGRGTGARNYHLLKGALTRLQSTVERTTIRHGEHWRRQQFSWINEWRSEEHTSELQSLMRISYAVFCLKKNKETTEKRKNNIYRT